jgi:hypothetical protein
MNILKKVLPLENRNATEVNRDIGINIKTIKIWIVKHDSGRYYDVSVEIDSGS